MKRNKFSTRFLGGELKRVNGDLQKWASLGLRIWKIEIRFQIVSEKGENLKKSIKHILKFKTWLNILN